MPTGSRPRLGQRVFSMSYAFLGTVARVTDSAYLLKLEDGEMWLSLRSVYSVGREGVKLLCDDSGLHRYEVPAPAGT